MTHTGCVVEPTLLQEIVNEHAPIKQKTIKGNHLPYMNGELRRAINVKRMLKRKFTKCNSNMNWDKYRKQRNLVTKLLKKSLQQYMQKKCNEAVNDLYRKLNGSVFVCFLDASKAFDRVNHTTLFKQLGARGIPGYILRILSYWYKNQDMCIRWGDAYSANFKVTNGVRQGGILSPYLFNVYVDELSEELNKCNVGCNLNGLLINHIMYADDLVLISPSSAGLSQLLRECEKFGTRYDVKYNAKKSAVMIYRSMTLKGCTIPNFNLNGMILHVVASYKYLGHYITDDLSDDDDINRQRRTLYVQGNIILRKFNTGS